MVSLHASSALAAPRLAIPSEGVAFGEIAAGEGASKSIEISNVSAFPVAVAQVKGCCGADASLSAMLIAPSESATLMVSLHPMLPGEFSKDVRILCDDPERPMLTIPVTGTAVEGYASAANAAASRFTLPAILLAGIVDGFNPCAFSIVIALAGILAVGGRQRRARMLGGWAFLGRRASTTTAEGTVRHVYDGIHCIADIDADGALLRTYVWGPSVDNLLAMTVHAGGSSETYYALADLQGTVHGFADAAGALAARYAYDAWGDLLAVETSVPALASNRYLFQGREYSHATGLYNFRARWYDPETGRWLSKDPIGLAGGLNLYAFCGDKPDQKRDPWGLSVRNNSEYDMRQPISMC